MSAFWGRIWRRIASHPRLAAVSVCAPVYLLLLLPLWFDAWHSDLAQAQDFVAARKAAKSAPLEPLPTLRVDAPDEIPFLRDPFQPLDAALPASSSRGPEALPADVDIAAAKPSIVYESRIHGSLRFIRSDLDLDQPFVIGRDAAGDLYRLRKGDRINGGTLVDIGPSRVVILIAGRAQEIEVRAED